MALMKLDVRQESGRHTETLDAVTSYLDLGVYNSRLLADVKEVLDTFKVAAELGSDSLGAYVISMASNASDVLAVELLQKMQDLQLAGTWKAMSRWNGHVVATRLRQGRRALSRRHGLYKAQKTLVGRRATVWHSR
ncbi:hypothetical protein HU200_020955 [Digitaria exilis]|uniref:Phosphoenolpyruvate carboxylase n=1 Tax=Digitaria exilis TaxID=1010633 RepID=A0A835F0N4_9POAL|nr:hypothetical protein HU200_020955 [Digitaria exilis]